MEHFITDSEKNYVRRNSFINRKIILRILGILLFIEAAMFLVSRPNELIRSTCDQNYTTYQERQDMQA